MTRANTSLVLFEQALAGNVETAGPPFAWARPVVASGAASVATLEAKAEITQGSTRGTFGVSWNHGIGTLQLDVRDPDGAEPQDSMTRRVRASRPYAFDVVQGSSLKPGEWTVRVTGTDLQNARLRFFVSEENRNVWLEAYPERYRIDPGEEIDLRARLFVPYSAPTATVSAWIGLPGQDWTQIKLIEGMAPGHGEGTPIYRGRWRSPAQIRGTYLVAVDAFVENATTVAVPKEKLQLKIPRTRRRLLFSVVVDDRVSTLQLPVHGLNSRRAWWHPDQQALLQAWKDRHKD